MTTAPYSYLADLARTIELPANGTLSQTVFQDARTKVVLFGFGAGQELSEHTASTPAILHFIVGQAALTLGDDSLKAAPGTWVHMPAALRHSIRAETPVVMLLILLK